MRWPKSWLLAAGVAAIACASPSRPVLTATPPPASPSARAPAASPWPDVARDARVEKSGAQDAAVVIAVERHATLPAVPGAHVSGEDWARFFRTVLGLPPASVTALFDSAATPPAVASAVQAATARVGPGGRLWFITVGHAVAGDPALASAAQRPDLQLISVLDVLPAEGPSARLAPAATRPGALPPITFTLARASPLPGAARPALSYLLMGALRGWGDRDHDGRVTAAEAAAYVDITLRLVAPRGTPEAIVSASTELLCAGLTTLAVAREPAPNALQIAPRVLPSAQGDSGLLAATLDAAQLSLAAGRFDESKRLLTLVLEARCGVDAAGSQAWDKLLYIANMTNATEDARRLASLECAYDEASLNARDALLRPIRMIATHSQTRKFYERAENESDATLARCSWSAAAEGYAASWWRDPEHSDQVEAAFNGAYAYRNLGRPDDAAALYHSYLQKQAGARPGESFSAADARRKYALSACASYLALAHTDLRHFPGYFAVCRNVDCTGLDKATCASFQKDGAAPALGARSAAEQLAQQLSLAAREREELAGWETTEAARAIRLREASEQYAAAEAAWTAVVGLGTAVPDPAEAARRLGEIAIRRVIVALGAGSEVTEESLENARKRARRARDLTFDERRREPARLLVELADAVLAREPLPNTATEGRRELPVAVAAAIAARDEYLASVPVTFDASEARYRMAYEAGDLEFRYGRLAEARQRLEPIYTMQCGLRPVAHEAWVLLISIANLESDVARGRSLAVDAAVCSLDAETRIEADRMRKPVRSIPFVIEGRRQEQAAAALPEGPERRTLRREAAAIFRHFARESPDRDEGPEAARLAGELYAELGEDRRALEMYRFFVDRYASHDRVSVVELERAYTALAKLHAQLGDYRAAALLLVEASTQKRLPAKTRAEAARKARELRADRDGRAQHAHATPRL